ncbi:MAG: SPX domain protein involved in polyphosphate accumulation [Polaribacter sp.]|jgi:SPX domain protein involved in polyphosphate accumulation
MRYERKYRLEITHLSVVEQIVKNHPASFTKAFPDRKVNNIYFDTPSLNCYQDNQMGVSQRKKFRVRWYGDAESTVENPTLEVKIRDNALGYKEVHELPSFDLDHLYPLTRNVNSQFGNLMKLQPVLYNSYERSYYESFNHKVRLTIDREMKFRSACVSPLSNQTVMEDPAVVVEIKYASNLETWATDMMQYIPFRMTKNSKYVNGIDILSFV